MPQPARPPPEVIDLESEAESNPEAPPPLFFTLDHSTLFHSSNPELQQLLEADPTDGGQTDQSTRILRRIRTKSSVDSGCVGSISTSSLLGLAGPETQRPITPATWKSFNRQLKAKEIKPRRKKGKKQRKSKKKKAEPKKAAAQAKRGEAGDAKISYATYKKRDHSKIWHAEYKYQVSELGKSELEAKQMAKRKAAVKSSECQSLRDQGQLPAYVADN